MEKKWINYIIVFVLSCTVFVILKCKSSQTDMEIATPEEAVVTDQLPSDFIDFYERFHNEEEYQMEHIIFPLKGHQQDSITMQLVPVTWQKENWVKHKPFNSYGGTWKRQYSNLDGIIFEKIYDSSETFTMQRRYAQIAGDWNLIYYSTFQMRMEE